MTNQDPIADREAKITALQASIDKARECLWRVCGQQSFRLKVCIPARPGVDDDCVIADGLEAGKEAVALMRSAPDGDAKLLELRDWVAKMPAGAFQGTTRMRLVDEIDRLLSKPSEPAPAAEIDRLRAENARLQADLAAARADQAAMARRELEWLRAAMDRWAKAVMDLTPTSGYRLDAINDVASTIRMRLAALPSQQPEPEPAAEAFRDAAKNCTGEMFGEQAAVKANGRNTVLMQPKPEVCGAPMRIVTGGTCASTKPCPTHDAEPVQWMAAGPVPDAATRDGDEVLREWLDPDTEGRPISGWVAVMARVLDEVCRRELARGGK